MCECERVDNNNQAEHTKSQVTVVVSSPGSTFDKSLQLCEQKKKNAARDLAWGRGLRMEEGTGPIGLPIYLYSTIIIIIKAGGATRAAQAIAGRPEQYLDSKVRD